MRYIPKEYNEMSEFNDVNAVVYQGEINGKYYAIGYSGKRNKSDFHYNFKTNICRQNFINNWVNNLLSRKKVKEERKEKRKSFQHTLKVGDILYSTWGYEQTNIDFYQVTKIVGKSSVKIREIGSKDVGNNQNHFMSATKVAIKDSFLEDSKEILKRVSPSYNDSGIVNLSSYECAQLWDGSPMNYSWYA